MPQSSMLLATTDSSWLSWRFSFTKDCGMKCVCSQFSLYSNAKNIGSWLEFFKTRESVPAHHYNNHHYNNYIVLDAQVCLQLVPIWTMTNQFLSAKF